MGLLISAKKLKEDLISSEKVQLSARFTFDVITNLLEQISSLPKVVYSGVTNSAVNKIMWQIFQTAAMQIVPIAVAQSITDRITNSISEYINENHEISISLYYLCLLSLYAVLIANLLWQINHQLEFLVSSAVLALGAPTKIKNDLNNFSSKICEQEHCSALRVVKGTARDNFTYLLIEAINFFIKRIPMAGPLLGGYFSVINSGQYILTVALPECYRHQTAFFQEYPGQVLGQGLGLLISTKLLSWVFENTTSLPGYGLGAVNFNVNSTIDGSYIEPFLFSLLIILHMKMALHMRFPPAVAYSDKPIVDPILFIKKQAGDYFDVQIVNLKEMILRNSAQTNHNDVWVVLQERMRSEKELLKNKLNTKIQELGNSINHTVEVFLPFIHDPLNRLYRLYNQNIYPLLPEQKIFCERLYSTILFMHLLPEVLTNTNSLFRHPIIGSFLQEWLNKAVRTFDLLDIYKKYWALRLVHEFFPTELKGLLGHKLLGIPNELVNFLFRLVYSPYLNQNLIRLEHFLKTLQLQQIGNDAENITQSPPLFSIPAGYQISSFRFFKDPKVNPNLELLSEALVNSIQEEDDWINLDQDFTLNQETDLDDDWVQVNYKK